MPLPLVGRVKKGITSTVGLGQEAYYHNKEKKEAAAAAGSSTDEPTTDKAERVSSDDPPSYDIDHDENDWIADDAQDQIHPGEPDESQEGPDTNKALQWFFSRHPSPAAPTGTALQPLPAPVVIPQKRPSTRTRGFVRAYAPALEDAGIDQPAFIDFLTGFDRSIAGQGYFNAANLAVFMSVVSYTAAVAPSVTVKLCAMAVHTSIEAGRRLYIAKKENSYLDEMNDRFFRPRGLYALIMAYKPGSNDVLATVDSTTVTNAAVSQRSGAEKSSSFKASSGKTFDGQLPEVCPLIYPTLDGADGEKKRNAFQRALAFNADYYDRRSHVEFNMKHGAASGIPMPDHEFRGSYSDPRNFQDSSLLGVLTNNKFDPRAGRTERRNARRAAQGRAPRSRSRNRSGSGGGRRGLVSRVLGDNVLYVMVVNMPSEAELLEAKQTLESRKDVAKNW